ncbi:MAG: hypothetical protein HC890_14870 [Chloroflexaceae bacterium]|nr:hypothetical protein [Chloroflexaceae bacterium]
MSRSLPDNGDRSPLRKSPYWLDLKKFPLQLNATPVSCPSFACDDRSPSLSSFPFAIAPPLCSQV